MLSALVQNESKRQLELVKIIHELRNRKAYPVLESFTDVTSVFKETQAKLVRKGIDSGAVVLGQKMDGFEGIIGRELQPGKRFGTELSNYAKMAGVKGIIHSDEDLSKYGITEDEKKHLEKKLGKCFILVVAPDSQARAALGHAVARANLDQVPEETRRANPDGTSTYMRPLPGKARLYPETDVPPIPVTKELLDSISTGESLEDKKKRFEQMLNKELAEKMLKSRHLHTFERLVESGADPKLAAITIENTIVSLRREGVEFQNIEESLVGLFEEYSKGTFVKAAVPEVLKGMAKGASAESVIKVYRLQKITGDALKKIVEEENYDLKAILAKHRLQVDPAEVAKLIKK
jgi:glutamyl-tRNA(Gln) amidotransferase subunit E